MPPTGEHFSAEGNLACHGCVVTHLALGQGRGDAGGDGDSGRRTVFRGGSLRHVDMDVPLLEDAVVYASGGRRAP